MTQNALEILDCQYTLGRAYSMKRESIDTLHLVGSEQQNHSVKKVKMWNNESGT